MHDRWPSWPTGLPSSGRDDVKLLSPTYWPIPLAPMRRFIASLPSRPPSGRLHRIISRPSIQASWPSALHSKHLLAPPGDQGKPEPKKVSHNRGRPVVERSGLIHYYSCCNLHNSIPPPTTPSRRLTLDLGSLKFVSDTDGQGWKRIPAVPILSRPIAILSYRKGISFRYIK